MTTNADICSEYALWKQNAPLLYDRLLVRALSWPSYTVSCVPSSQGAPFSLLVSPTEPSPSLVSIPFRPACSPVPLYTSLPAPVLSARPSPLDSSLIAVSFQGPHAPYLCRNKVVSQLPVPAGSFVQGGLLWAPQGIAGGVGTSVILWDEIKRCEKHKFTCPAQVDDLAAVGSSAIVCTTGGRAFVHDTRSPETETSLVLVTADTELVSVSASDKGVACGCLDGSVRVWDLRSPELSAHVLQSRKTDSSDCCVTRVLWKEEKSGILASAGRDRRVRLWNLGRKGMRLDEEQEREGPPELVFTHGGHTAPVYDICWCSGEGLTLASVAQDNTLQVWTVPAMF